MTERYIGEVSEPARTVTLPDFDTARAGMEESNALHYLEPLSRFQIVFAGAVCDGEPITAEALANTGHILITTMLQTPEQTFPDRTAKRVFASTLRSMIPGDQIIKDATAALEKKMNQGKKQ